MNVIHFRSMANAEFSLFPLCPTPWSFCRPHLVFHPLYVFYLIFFFRFSVFFSLLAFEIYSTECMRLLVIFLNATVIHRIPFHLDTQYISNIHVPSASVHKRFAFYFCVFFCCCSSLFISLFSSRFWCKQLHVCMQTNLKVLSAGLAHIQSCLFLVGG